MHAMKKQRKSYCILLIILQLSGIPTDVKEATYTPYRSCIVNETLVHGSKSLQAEWKQLTRPSGKGFPLTLASKSL